MSGDGRGVEKGGDGDDGGARRAICTEDGRWRLTTVVDDEGGGHSMAAGVFYVGGGVLCRQRWPTARRRRLNNQMKEEATPSNAFRRAKRRWWGVCGMSAMAPSAGLWECRVVGAAAAVHLWGASSLEGRRQCLPTRERPHWSHAFNNAGDGTGASRGGGGAKRCDATTSWREQRGGVEDGYVQRLPDEM